MGKYGETAIRAAKLLHDGCESADTAWRAAAAELFANAPEARDKVCPRETFLGLCAGGYIDGKSSGTDIECSDSPNRTYAITAFRLLSSDPDLARGKKIGLWRRVMQALELDPEKNHNAQMDVVLAIWRWRSGARNGDAACSGQP